MDQIETGENLLVGKCNNCNKMNSIAVKDETIKPERLGHHFKNRGKEFAEAGKKLSTNLMKNPKKTLEKGGKTGNAAVSRIPKAALATISDVSNSDHTAKGLSLGKFV